MPVMANEAVFTFQTGWNDFLAPLTNLHDQAKCTISLGLSFFCDSFDTRWSYLTASSRVTVLPAVMVFFLAQRVFVQGITLTGMVGKRGQREHLLWASSLFRWALRK